MANRSANWASARFTRRTTESAPTKSAVIGMLAAAAGIERRDDAGLASLAALRFAVRIDQPGTRVRDFQTAHHGASGKSMPLSERFYLADAIFVAAVKGDPTLLAGLHAALRNPVYAPFLGRRSCPPAQPVDLGLQDGSSLMKVLSEVPWQASACYRGQHRGRSDVELTVLREADGDEASFADTFRDQPISYAAEHRRHALRAVVSDGPARRRTTPRPRVRTVHPHPNWPAGPSSCSG
ncbi:type I-E CRISPR-associated protein Cas5/CasD [Streptomyces clavifer]|uniref:type I-E CRISPR-associated protein Cas5/CasD n=1 Tax=Streptomyces clavifer TaxID=68188 RepID=UPI00331B2067